MSRRMRPDRGVYWTYNRWRFLRPRCPHCPCGRMTWFLTIFGNRVAVCDECRWEDR